VDAALLAPVLRRTLVTGRDVGAQSRRYLAKLPRHPAKGCPLALIGCEIADQVAITGVVEQLGQYGLHVFHGSNDGRPTQKRELHM